MHLWKSWKKNSWLLLLLLSVCFFVWNSQCMWLRFVVFQENLCERWLEKLFHRIHCKIMNDRMTFTLAGATSKGCFVVVSIYEPENTMPRWMKFSFQKKRHWNDMMLASSASFYHLPWHKTGQHVDWCSQTGTANKATGMHTLYLVFSSVVVATLFHHGPAAIHKYHMSRFKTHHRIPSHLSSKRYSGNPRGCALPPF